MNINNINKIFKIKSYSVFEKQKKERDKLSGDFINRGMMSSGAAYQALTDKYKDQMKELSDIFIESIVEFINGSKGINQNIKKQLISKYHMFISNQTQMISTTLKGQLISTNFPKSSSESIINGLKNKISQVREVGIHELDLILDKYQNNNDNKYKEESKNEIMNLLDEKAIWKNIENEYEISKRAFGKKINFIEDTFFRKVIFRDIAHAFYLASLGFSKPSVILSGSVIEGLLQHYLKFKGIKPDKDNFDSYIKACTDNGFLKIGISKLTDSVRHFRNYVHIQKEKSKKHTISKPTAISSVASIFIIANDF